MEQSALAGLAEPDLRVHLLERSGLPGPRANLALADEAARVLPAETLERLADDQDEYLALCGATGLGRLVLDPARRPAVVRRLATLAADERWRVREGVARGLQAAAAVDPEVVRELTATWCASGDLRLLRAAVATLCEPPLLRGPALRLPALDACRVATAALLERRDQRDEAWSSLLKTLEYAWSVAVAADPEAGVPAFEALRADPDPLVQRIAAKNLGKARMAKLGMTAPPGT